MKIAIVYRGDYIRKKFKYNFLKSNIDNHKEMVLKYFPNCDLFFSTTPSDEIYNQELTHCFEWKNFNFTTSNTCVYDSIKSSLNFYDFCDYDIIVNLRFDLKFNKPITSFNIDYDKFNFVWLEPTNYNQNGNIRVCDLMFVFPTKFLVNFENINLEDVDVRYADNSCIGPPDQAHHLMQFLHLDQKTNVNFMVDGRHESGGQRYNPVSKSFLEIHRGN